MSFESLGLAAEILQAIQDCGYTEPTPIQEQAIPHLLAGRDIMGCAQTGTGKTAAFALPILQQLRQSPPGHLRALVLVPTRELAIQVGRNIREYSQRMDLRSTAVYGGVPIGPQEMMLRHGVDILVATPGRLKDHLWRGLIDFRETKFLVLDEADRMLDMGFIDDVREIVNLIPKERQTMLFSATLEPEIRRLSKDLLRDPVRIEVAPPATVADGIEHLLLSVAAENKRTALEDLLQQPEMHRILIFTRTRRSTHQLALHLHRHGHRVSSIHSDKSQSQRVAALEAFRAGKIDLLVATDIAARGLDVDGISHVVNYDLPRNADDYVHRIGRTARAGHKGVAISLVTSADWDVVHSIERLIGRPLETRGSRAEEFLRGAGTRPAARSRTAGRGSPRSGHLSRSSGPDGPRRASRSNGNRSSSRFEEFSRPDGPVRYESLARTTVPVAPAIPARSDVSLPSEIAARSELSARSDVSARSISPARTGRSSRSDGSGRSDRPVRSHGSGRSDERSDSGSSRSSRYAGQTESARTRSSANGNGRRESGYSSRREGHGDAVSTVRRRSHDSDSRRGEHRPAEKKKNGILRRVFSQLTGQPQH